MIETGILNWTLNQFLVLVIIMTRVGPLVFLMPVLSSRSVPAQVKVMLSLMTSLALTPVVNVTPASLPSSAVGFLVFVLCEIGFGAILAVFAWLIFAAVDTAGQMVGVQMGMGVAGTMDPQFGNQVSLAGQFWSIITILLFLGMNGHHLYFKTLVESFAWVKPGGLHITQATYTGMMRGAAHMFVLAIKIMAPASAALFFSHVAMGIIAKTVPQIPILIVGLPLNIATGLVFMGLSLGYFLPLMAKNFDMLGRLLSRLAMGMGG